MYRILIVEDEQAIARTVAEELSHWGLESRCVEKNFRRHGEISAFQPQLVLLGIMLPFSMAITGATRDKKMLQCTHHFPVLSADNMNIVMAVNMGETIYCQSLLTDGAGGQGPGIVWRCYDFSSHCPHFSSTGARELNTGDNSLCFRGEKNRTDEKRIQDPPVPDGE